ncbi:hypothetical protein FisN_UnNu033 [Fistulifera solaris]|uniref:PI3K/PI4K catalytic domain-containing protein n=1 Tax=Fistulifera solaris TaxID=1519565 RepID=A0A1Z5JB43_FISSO|nr:hypothetical protein FisN_UnNu033 [Fistulifera solaris]|eukprot:GAX11223.1 hypothetical protein FisN_UnNu033 [Fistulifera solaris]
MVILVAALYTVYQQQMNQKREGNPDEDASDFYSSLLEAALEQFSPRSQKESDNEDEDVETNDEEKLENSSPQHVTNLSTSVSNPQIDSAIQNEWWNAVFGLNWKPSTQSTVGLAGYKSTISQQLRLPSDTEKLGITISRLALGVSVRNIQPNSPAAVAGVPVHAVLLEMNGIPLLAEPTRTALERLWQYQGFAQSGNRMDHPVRLRFIKGGRIRTYLITGRPPWGITWGPCGQFALVKKTRGVADEIGIKRGAIISAVDEHVGLDHVAAAGFLKDGAKTITYSLPPMTARSQRRTCIHDVEGETTALRKTSVEGVQVTFHPVWSMTKKNSSIRHTEADLRMLADQVAAGFDEIQSVSFFDGIVAPRAEEAFPSCPILSDEQIIEAMDPLSCALYCWNMLHDDFEPPVACDRWKISPASAKHAHVLILPLLSLLCFSHESKEPVELTVLLLKLSRRDESMQQYLYYALRSYIATLETRKDGNLMALLHCLELLRFAEKELASRVLPDIEPSIPPSPTSTVEQPLGPEEGKRYLRFFRKKKKRTTPRKQLELDIVKSASSTLSHTPSTVYESMSDFLSELDRICSSLERFLQKSFRQKLTDWAVSAWSASKGTALADVTSTLRRSLKQPTFPLLNPVDPSQYLTKIVTEECYILPSAHFPILLTFEVDRSEESLFLTEVQLESLVGEIDTPEEVIYTVDMTVGGCFVGSTPGEIKHNASGKSMYQWTDQKYSFATRDRTPPSTLSIRLSSRPKSDSGAMTAIGYGWIDLTHDAIVKRVQLFSLPSFDTTGASTAVLSPFELKLNIRTRKTALDVSKRLLLYKHDDDLRQEAFAVKFLQICDRLFQKNGLDLHLLTFDVVPVGTRRGFVEWISGSIPLSELCENWIPEEPSMIRKAGLTKYENISDGSSNPVQDYLRSCAFDGDAPYWISKVVMDRYIKSCAGYSILTYILGVGDRHLDNLLIHSSGAFFHCDYSFLMGSDPKAYLPLRITPHMLFCVYGKRRTCI